MEQALTFTDPDGHTISGVLARPEKKTDRIAVFCHGFLSNKNSATNRALTEILVPQGIATFRFDFFGQGDSEGPFENITVTTAQRQAQAALDLVKTKGYRKIALVGSSFGGLVALLTAAKNPKLSCLALKCPVPDFPEMLRLEFGDKEMAAWKKTGTIPNVIPGAGGRIKLAYGFFEDCTRHSGYDAAKAVAAPALIVQGNSDEYVPLHQSRRLSEELRGKNVLVVLPGADHHFSKPEDFREMTTLLAQWVSDHLKPNSTASAAR
ncbi:MAG: alpha/beta fold hydrolase [Nitrospirae bacterium]|nr:MAG: alpha/beta fold hydrolase [Nitrospirota bacterium]